MALRPDYVSGTISLTNGSATVTGTGTAWTIAPALAGDELIDINGALQYRMVIAADAASDTSLTLTRPWPGPTLNKVGYRLRFRSDAERVMGKSVDLIERISSSALAAFAGVSTGARKGVRFDAVAAASLFDLSDKAVTLLGKADEAAMRDFLSVAKKQSDALDASGGAGLLVGAFGLGGAIGVQPSGTNLDSLAITQLLNPAEALPAGWDATLGSYPMGLHWQRSETVQAQFAIGYNGNAGFRAKSNSVNWQPWRRLYHNYNVLGTVAQSSGVPTGAIVERGSNANGTYVRLTDGTQICWQSFTAPSLALTTAIGSLFRTSTEVSFTCAASFAQITGYDVKTVGGSGAALSFVPLRIRNTGSGTISFFPGSLISQTTDLTFLTRVEGTWF